MSDCCLDQIDSEDGAQFDCSMRGLNCCLENEINSCKLDSACRDNRLAANVLAALFDCDYRERIYPWVGSSGTQYVCIVFRYGDEEIIARFSDLAVIGVAREGDERRPVSLRHSRDFSPVDNRNLREAARKTGCNEWHVHFAGNYEKFCRDFVDRQSMITAERFPFPEREPPFFRGARAGE